jgi:hypothetical protein
MISHAPTPALKQYAPRNQYEKDITNPPMNQPERLSLVVAPNNCLACQSPQDISPVVCNVSGMSLENKERLYVHANEIDIQRATQEVNVQTERKQ